MKTKEEINEMPAAELREQVLLTKQELFSLNLLKAADWRSPIAFHCCANKSRDSRRASRCFAKKPKPKPQP